MNEPEEVEAARARARVVVDELSKRVEAFASAAGPSSVQRRINDALVNAQPNPRLFKKGEKLDPGPIVRKIKTQVMLLFAQKLADIIKELSACDSSLANCNPSPALPLIKPASSVGAVGFAFERAEGSEDWTGGEAITLGRGTEVDEAWLTQARQVAIEALKRDMSAASDEEFVTVTCSECGRILSHPNLSDDTGKLRGIDCGPAHALRFERGQTLTFNPDGTAEWTSIGG